VWDGVVAGDGGQVLCLDAGSLAQVAAADHRAVADVGQERHCDGQQGP